MKIAFVGAKVYPVTSLPIENGIVLVENGKIVKVGTNLSTDGYEIIDCNDLHLTPGFVDCHTHTGIWEEGSGPGPGNNDGNELSDSITPYVRVLDAIHPEDVGFGDARKGGVTTLGITHGSANAIGGQISVAKSTGTIADDMVILQPAGLKFAMGENPKRVGDWKNRAPTTRMGVAALIRKAFYEARDYEEEWEQYKWQLEFEEKQPEDKRKRVKKPKYDYGKEILLKVLRREIPVRNHAHRADDIITAIRLSEEFGYRLIVDHATESIKVKERIVEKNIPIAVGPLFGGRSKRELVDQSMSTPGELVKAGAFVAIMTDSPFNPVHGLRDNVIFAIREGLPEEKAMETITINPAIILGVDNRVGSIEAGKDADLLLFNGDPFDGRNRVVKTYIEGKLVFSS